MKISRVLFLVVAVMLFLCLPVISHSGRTDSKGGHRNSATGEYHYHHGHSAHQHTDLDGDGVKDCPYDFVNKTGQSSGNNSSSSTISKPTTPDHTHTDPISNSSKSSVTKKILSTVLISVLFPLFSIFAFAFVIWICYVMIKHDQKKKRRRRWY